MSERRAALDQLHRLNAEQMHVEDQRDAERAVAVARARLHEVRRQFIRRQAGAATVAQAEHALGAALDQLARATRDSSPK